MKKMKAAVMYGSNDIRVEQVDRPVCDENGMIFKIEAIGLCGSDIRNLSTDSRKGAYPHIYGHEHAGILVEVGSKVKGFKAGDKVYISPDCPCFKCNNCRRGMSNLCTDFKAFTDFQGGFAEYMPIPAWGIERGNILPIPEGVKFENVTLTEPLSSVYSCQETVNVRMGDVVVIMGAGPIGCLHSQLAKMRGASKVIMVEINQGRLEAALKFGVDHIINSKETDPVEAVMNLTNGVGANHVISANPSTVSQQQAIFMCTPGGIVSFFGGVPKGVLTEIDTNHIHYMGIWIYGHTGFTPGQNKKAFDLVCSGQFNAEKYITHIMPLDEINKAIGLAKSGETMKIVLIP